MRKLMSILLLSCEQASLIMIKKEDEKLSFIDRSRLWIHRKVCHLCSEFHDQNKFINLNVKFHANHESHPMKLSPSSKEKIAKELNINK